MDDSLQGSKESYFVSENWGDQNVGWSRSVDTLHGVFGWMTDS
jgi:hypothetical protein